MRCYCSQIRFSVFCQMLCILLVIGVYFFRIFYLAAELETELYLSVSPLHFGIKFGKFSMSLHLESPSPMKFLYSNSLKRSLLSAPTAVVIHVTSIAPDRIWNWQSFEKKSMCKVPHSTNTVASTFHKQPNTNVGNTFCNEAVSGWCFSSAFWGIFSFFSESWLFFFSQTDTDVRWSQLIGYLKNRKKISIEAQIVLN